MTQERSFSFTDKALKGLPTPPKPAQRDYFDTGARGLGLRVSYGGRKSFFAMYSNAKGKRQRLGLGEYGRLEHGKLSLAEARKRAKARLGEVAKDKDPAGEARVVRVAPTVQTLIIDFIAMQYKRGRKSAAQQERILVRDVVPVIGDMKARDVRRGDIKSLLSEITDRPAPVLANRVHEVVRTMFNFGIEEEDYGIENNPADRLGNHRNPEQARDRAEGAVCLRRQLRVVGLRVAAHHGRSAVPEQVLDIDLAGRRANRHGSEGVAETMWMDVAHGGLRS